MSVDIDDELRKFLLSAVENPNQVIIDFLLKLRNETARADALEARVKELEWQSIETSPKDGTTVDILVNGYRVTDCKFLNGEWVEWVDRESKWCWSGEPTHWIMPPPPPAPATRTK